MPSSMTDESAHEILFHLNSIARPKTPPETPLSIHRMSLSAFPDPVLLIPQPNLTIAANTILICLLICSAQSAHAAWQGSRHSDSK